MISKDILSEEERLSEQLVDKWTAQFNNKDLTGNDKKLLLYHKALYYAEKEIEDLKVQLGEGLTKEFFRKEVIRLNKELSCIKEIEQISNKAFNLLSIEAKERYEKAVDFLKFSNFYQVFNILGEEMIEKAFKIASGYEE
jgi:hypothetical protein